MPYWSSAHRIAVGWTNLDQGSRKACLIDASKIDSCLNQSDHPDPATSDELFKFNLLMLGFEIVEGGLGFEPRIGEINAPYPSHPDSWQLPAYIVPMNL